MERVKNKKNDIVEKKRCKYRRPIFRVVSLDEPLYTIARKFANCESIFDILSLSDSSIYFEIAVIIEDYATP